GPRSRYPVATGSRTGGHGHCRPDTDSAQRLSATQEEARVMARYTGPVCRLCRRQGMKLFLKGERCFTPKCAVERRPTPPGASPSDRRRRKESEFSLQLKEKQKARHIYGVLERQFHKHFVAAEHQPGVTGENLLRVLEMRLDNVVYRLGFADSRRQSRQLVLHGHITLNGRRTNIATAQVKSR